MLFELILDRHVLSTHCLTGDQQTLLRKTTMLNCHLGDHPVTNTILWTPVQNATPNWEMKVQIRIVIAVAFFARAALSFSVTQSVHYWLVNMAHAMRKHGSLNQPVFASRRYNMISYPFNNIFTIQRYHFYDHICSRLQSPTSVFKHCRAGSCPMSCDSDTVLLETLSKTWPCAFLTMLLQLELGFLSLEVVCT